MEEGIEPTKEFVKGFNAGYQLGKHVPELLNSIVKFLVLGSDFISALKSFIGTEERFGLKANRERDPHFVLQFLPLIIKKNNPLACKNIFK